MRQSFKKLAYSSPEEMVFGSARCPLTFANGLSIGGGHVLPEVNFTLSPMTIDQTTMPDILREYRQMASSVLGRAADLQVRGVVLEVELLPPMTTNPSWGGAVIQVVREEMERATGRGVKSLLRATPNDTRDHLRPPIMRSGAYLETMLRTFEEVARAGAHMLAIESTGGKELCDWALVNADLEGVIYSLAVLGARDMQFLWAHIVDIAERHHIVASGDTACGFGNTAMVLAEQGYVPRIFAALVRVITVVRSLVAYEMGATGPSKDCAYEGPYIKAITGYPISMEGRTAACAHLSPVGNVAGAVCDLWSNESVQNIKLLGGMAPVVSLEQLAYDCRLFDQASAGGIETARILRNWLVGSDAPLDPQAYVLSPQFAFEVSREIVSGCDHYHSTVLAVSKAISLLRAALESGRLNLAERELPWLSLFEDQVASLPSTGEELWERLSSRLDRELFLPSEYGVAE